MCHNLDVGSNLVNILSDFFFVNKDINFASYAGDNTIYQSGNNVDDVLNGLQISVEISFCWFTDSQVKGNTHKFHLLVRINNNQKYQGRRKETFD